MYALIDRQNNRLYSMVENSVVYWSDINGSQKPGVFFSIGDAELAKDLIEELSMLDHHLDVISATEAFLMKPDPIEINTQDQSYNEAMKEGASAREAGLGYNENPYPVTDLEFFGWNNGWIGSA